MDPPGRSRVCIRENMSSALNGVGLWMRLCATLLLKAHGTEVCHYEIKEIADGSKRLSMYRDGPLHKSKWGMVRA